MHTRRAPCTTTTQSKAAFFDRISKNALQNVMSFFEYKGTDFMKMRSINRKTKSSYMQELARRFNVERQISSLSAEFRSECEIGLKQFIWSSYLLESEHLSLIHI